LQDVGDAFLFRDLKTCNGLRTAAAALARPLELANVDVQVIPVSSSFLFLGSKRASNTGLLPDNQLSVLFSIERRDAYCCPRRKNSSRKVLMLGKLTITSKS